MEPPASMLSFNSQPADTDPIGTGHQLHVVGTSHQLDYSMPRWHESSTQAQVLMEPSAS